MAWKEKEYQSKRYTILKKNKICLGCGGEIPILRENVYCEKCAKRTSDSGKQLRLYRKNNHLCVKCGKKITDKMFSCLRCRENEKKYWFNKNKTRRLKKVESKRNLIIKHGGKCSLCGLVSDIPDVYDFHHNNEEAKISDVSKLNPSRQKAESNKCVMVCSNCHRTIHYKLRNGN